MLSLLKNLSSLSVNKPSKHPTAIDSVHIATTDFGEENAAARDAEEPLVTDVVVKHSSAFNSERASGMNKVQQLQFVELIKGMIIDEAPIAYPAFTHFKIVTSRRDKASPASPREFCSTTVCVAALLGISQDGGVVVEKSTECEYLADAVEDLWEKIGVRMGVLAEGFKIGDRVSGQAEGNAEREISGLTVVVSER